MSTHRLTGFNITLSTATERKREHLSSKPECRRSNTLNAQHMDALVSFVLVGTMHTALPQLLERTAKLASLAFKAHRIEGIPPHMPLLLLLAAEAHPSRAKAGHIKCLARKWPAVRHSEEVVHFLKSWRECLCKTQLWSALKFNLCSYSLSVCSYRDGEAEGQCRCLLWSYQALSEPWSSWQEQCCLHGGVSPFFPNLPGDNIGESR